MIDHSTTCAEKRVHGLGTTLALLLCVALGLGLLACRTPKGSTATEKRRHVVATNRDVLESVYAAEPGARAQVDKSIGYATFSNIETKIAFLTSGNGYGMAVDRRSGARTFMSMRKFGAGIGAGVQEFQLLMVFKSPETFERFLDSGWQFGGGAEAALEHRESEEGGQADMQVNIEMDPIVYQVTEAGIALSATVEGFKFSKDDELN